MYYHAHFCLHQILINKVMHSLNKDFSALQLPTTELNINVAEMRTVNCFQGIHKNDLSLILSHHL